MDTRTVKVYDTTASIVKRLSEDCPEGRNMSQIIAKAVLDHAIGLGYVYTKTGLVGEGDMVCVDGNTVKVLEITKDRVIMSDNLSITRGGKAVLNLEKIYE